MDDSEAEAGIDAVLEADAGEHADVGEASEPSHCESSSSS